MRHRRRVRDRPAVLLSAISLLVGNLVTSTYAQETPLTSVKVSSRLPNGVTIDLPPVTGSSPLRHYAHYRFAASGTYIWNTSNLANVADSECTHYSPVGGLSDPTWQRDRFGVLTTNDLTDDLQDLYVAGRQVDWAATIADETGCNSEDHTYQFSFASTEFPSDPVSGARKVNLRIYDSNYADNADPAVESITVKIFPGVERQKGPNDIFIETVTVDSRDPRGGSTLAALVAGEQYKFVARGVYSYSSSLPGWLADAECSVTGKGDPNVPEDVVWKPQRSWIATDTTDYLDLTVNSREVAWQPLFDSGTGCNDQDHTYRHHFTPKTTGRVNFAIQHYHFGFNAGSLSVDVYLVRAPDSPPPNPVDVGDAGVGQPAKDPSSEPPLAVVNVSAKSPNGKEVDLPGVLNPDGTVGYFPFYRLEVGGTYIWDYTNLNHQADAECSRYLSDPTWQQNRFGLSKAVEQGSRDVSQDPFDLYVNRAPVDWKALTPDAFGCNTKNHTYDHLLPLTASRKVRLSVYEPFFSHTRTADTQNVSDADPANDYSFTVKIFAGPEPRSGPNDVLIERVRVDSSKPSGASTLSALVAGQLYRLVVGGMYAYDWRTPGTSVADAECAIRTGDPTWRAKRSWAPAVPDTPGDDLLDLFIDGEQVDWSPLFDTGGGCNTSDHTYRLFFQPKKTAPATFVVRHTVHAFAAGLLDVDVFLVRGEAAPTAPTVPVDEDAKKTLFPSSEPSTETPLEIIKVPAGKSAGAFSQKNWQTGRFYRMEVSGQYLWDFRVSGNRADAECTQFAVTNGTADTTWQAKRFPGGNIAGIRPDAMSDPFDLYVDGSQVDWEPLSPDPISPKCNSTNNTYQFVYSPTLDKIAGTSSALNFRVHDPFFGNAFAGGELVVKIFTGAVPKAGPNDVLVETVQVDSSKPDGASTLSLLAGGQQYRFVADGRYLYDYRTRGAEADAECSITPADPAWRGQRSWAPVVPDTPGDDLLDLFVNGSAVAWTPLLDTGGGCNAKDHTYELNFRPGATTRVNFRIRHTVYSYDFGVIKVEVYLVRSPGTPDAPGAGTGTGTGTQLFASREPSKGIPMAVATVSARPARESEIALPAFLDPQGNRRYYPYYRFEVSGTYVWDFSRSNRLADAECSTDAGDPSWRSNRFPFGNPQSPTLDLGSDPLDLYVDGSQVDWEPLAQDFDSIKCNSKNHTYELTYRNDLAPTAGRSVKFRVHDPIFNNQLTQDTNADFSLTVKIFSGAEPVNAPTDVLVDSVRVDSRKPEGASSLPLIAGQRYRFVVGGIYTYDFRTEGNTADAECSSTGVDQVWRARRSWQTSSGQISEGVELLDLLVNRGQVDWVPLFDVAGTGCNTQDHTYRHFFRPRRSEPVEFRVHETFHGFSDGVVTVSVYLSRS